MSVFPVWSLTFSHICRAAVLALGGLLIATHVQAQEQPGVAPVINWQQGPTNALIGSVAEIDVPAGYQYTGVEGTRVLLELLENPVGGSELGILMPSSEDATWFVVFEFSDIGYVKDDEKNELDADAILASIRKGNEEGNKLRRQRGWASLQILGWEQPPRYDPQSNNLEWAIRASSEGETVVNYNTRLLGRTGVMEANLVVDPQELSTALPEFHGLLNNYAFQPGKKYSEFRSGDKIAQYGLTALVTGGAAAVALKSGLLQKLWKFIVIDVIAVGAFLKKIFGGGGARA